MGVLKRDGKPDVEEKRCEFCCSPKRTTVIGHHLRLYRIQRLHGHLVETGLPLAAAAQIEAWVSFIFDKYHIEATVFGQRVEKAFLEKHGVKFYPRSNPPVGIERALPAGETGS